MSDRGKVSYELLNRKLSGLSQVDYSTSEQWTKLTNVLGSKIYQKTIIVTRPPYQGTRYFAHGIQNMKALLDFSFEIDFVNPSSGEPVILLPRLKIDQETGYAIELENTIESISGNNCYVRIDLYNELNANKRLLATLYYTCKDR